MGMSPDAPEIQTRLAEARAKYARVVRAWAQDVLELRRTGRDVPRRTLARRLAVFPGAAGAGVAGQDARRRAA